MTIRVLRDFPLVALNHFAEPPAHYPTEATAQLLGFEHRQVLRLLKTYRIAGAAGLISKRRGCPSNRCKPAALRTKALALIRERCWDFGPSLAAEKLREVHGITLGRETLRLWMVEAGLWLDRKQAKARPLAALSPRMRRRAGAGRRLRGPQCTLLVFIDDATSRLMHLQFVKSGATPDLL
jgi:hypothetical protein